MSSTSDPIRRWRSRTRTMWAIAAPLLAGAAAWAVLVPAPWSVGVPDLAPADRARAEAVDAGFDIAVFDARLWVDPPSVVVAAVRRPPPPPAVKLQLLAVVRVPGDAGETTLQAAIYDPDSDRLLFVTDGERVGRFTVTAVNTSGTTLSDGTREVTLSLTEGNS